MLAVLNRLPKASVQPALSLIGESNKPNLCNGYEPFSSFLDMILKMKVLIIDNMLYYRHDGIYGTHLGCIL